MKASKKVVNGRLQINVDLTTDDLVGVLKGGTGSGNFGHSGRPGHVGGSGSGSGGEAASREKGERKVIRKELLDSSTNDVYRLTFDTGEVGYFKFQHQEQQIYGAFKSGTQAGRAVAASIVADNMKLERVDVPETFMMELEGRKGVVQLEAKGNSAKNENINELKQNRETLSDVLFYDALIGNADRHDGNMYLQDKKAILIDNDNTFGDNPWYYDRGGFPEGALDRFDSFELPEGRGVARLRNFERVEGTHATKWGEGTYQKTTDFDRGLTQILERKTQLGPQLKDAGLSDSEIKSFWNRASYLKSTSSLNYDKNTLARIAIESDGKKVK